MKYMPLHNCTVTGHNSQERYIYYFQDTSGVFKDTKKRPLMILKLTVSCGSIWVLVFGLESKIIKYTFVILNAAQGK